MKRRKFKPNASRRIFSPAFFRRLKTKFISVIKLGLIFLLFSGTLGGLYYLVFQTSEFELANIKVVGAQEFVNKEDVLLFAETNYLGENLLFVKKREIENSLKNLFLGAEEVDVKKELPDALLIQIRERIPLAILHNERHPDGFMIDKEGYVLGLVDESHDELPSIYYSAELKVGNFVDKNLVPVFYELLEAIRSSDVKVSSISFYPRHVTFYTSGGIKVLVGNEKDKFGALSTLSKLLHNLTLEGKNATSVDLRYDKVVVSY